MREAESRDDSDANACQRESRSLAEHQSENVVALCTQSHADSDFVRTLCHAVRNHSVYSDCSEH